MPVAANTMTPPPTVNSLDASQRARLLKSTRKLENLLGATPHVLDPESSSLSKSTTPVHEKRRGTHLYLNPSAASSLASFSESASSHESFGHPLHRYLSHTPILPSTDAQMKKHTRQKSAPRLTVPPLVLRLQPVSSLPSLKDSGMRMDSAEIPAPLPPATAAPSPVSPIFAPEEDPMSPIDVREDRDKVRRKRMAKLTRTLGENIPLELVFAHSPHFPQHQKSPSEPIPPPSRWPDWRRREAETTRLKKQQQHRPTSIANNIRVHISPPPPPSKSVRTVTQKHRRSASVGSLVHNAINSSSSLLPSLDKEKPFTLTRSVSNDRQIPDDYSWNGEWNIKDADKRAMALRNLRSR